MWSGVRGYVVTEGERVCEKIRYGVCERVWVC